MISIIMGCIVGYNITRMWKARINKDYADCIATLLACIIELFIAYKFVTML